MAVYVDDMDMNYRHPASGWNMKMSHMIADSSEELLAMAEKIGVNKKWIQNEGTIKEHFDISLSKKKLAIRCGAILLSAKELLIVIGRKKGTRRSRKSVRKSGGRSGLC